MSFKLTLVCIGRNAHINMKNLYACVALRHPHNYFDHARLCYCKRKQKLSGFYACRPTFLFLVLFQGFKQHDSYESLMVSSNYISHASDSYRLQVVVLITTLSILCTIIHKHKKWNKHPLITMSDTFTNYLPLKCQGFLSAHSHLF